MRRYAAGLATGLLLVVAIGKATVAWTSVRSARVADWMPTYRCENGGHGWSANTGNGYFGGLQFSQGTWVAHGGRAYASRADLAAPTQQVLVASRLRYDGWPSCPNPPRYR